MSDLRGGIVEVPGGRIAYDVAGDGPPVVLDPPATTRLESISCPVLALYGDLDVPAEREGAEELGQRVPDVRVECIEGTAHLPSLERPDAFNQAVLPGLDRVATSAD